MGSKRAKLMVSLAQKESYQNVPICTEDSIEIGALDMINVQLDFDSSTLGICSESEVSTILPEKQENTDGCFLKITTSTCDGFRIQPDEKNKNTTQVIFYQNEELGELGHSSDSPLLLENSKGDIKF